MNRTLFRGSKEFYFWEKIYIFSFGRRQISAAFHLIILDTTNTNEVRICDKLIYDGFILHDLHLLNRVEFESATQPDNYQLDTSRWNIVHDCDLKSRKTRPSLLLTAEKPTPINRTLSLISLVGVLKSLRYLCHKDILLLGILAQFMILLSFTRGISGR